MSGIAHMPHQQAADKRASHGKPARVSDVQEIVGYTHYLLMKGQMAGNMTLDGHEPTNEEQEIAVQCKVLSNDISRLLDKCRDEEIALLLECYDLAYRLGHGKMPDRDYIDNRKRRIFEAWKAGNMRIEESVVFGIVAADVRQNNTRTIPEYRETYIKLKSKWLDTLRRFNRFPGVTTYENYQRLALIMRENLSDSCNNEKAAKQEWFEHNKVDDLSCLNSRILSSYRRFALALFPDVLTYKEQVALDFQILSELSCRHDLGYYEREAFRLAVGVNRKVFA